MDYHKLEITLHSANDLFDVKHFGTMNPYVVFWVAGDGKSSEKWKTRVAKKGGSCPVWNCSMEFKFNFVPLEDNYSFFFEIKHDGTFFDREIGQGHVPLKDLLTGDGCGERVSYPVEICSGLVKYGEIILSYKFTKLEDTNVEQEKKKKKRSSFAKDIAKDLAIQVGSTAIQILIEAIFFLNKGPTL